MGGSSKSQTVGYNYYMGAHLILCRGPVDKITKIITQNKVAWSGNQVGSGRISINQPALFGGSTSQGGVVGDLDFEVGSLTQGQNDYLASQLGSEYLPSFRNVVGIVMRRMALGMNPYIQPFSWDLSRIHTRKNGIMQWYDAKSEIATPSINGIWSYKVIDPGMDNKGYQDPFYVEDGTWTTGLSQSEVPFTSNGNSILGPGWGLPCGPYPYHASNIWYRVHFEILVAQNITFNVSASYAMGDIWINGKSLSVVAGKVYIPASMLIAGQNVLAMKFEAGFVGSAAYYLYGSTFDMPPSAPIVPANTFVIADEWGAGLRSRDIINFGSSPGVTGIAYRSDLNVVKLDGSGVIYVKSFALEHYVYDIYHLDQTDTELKEFHPAVPNTYTTISFAFESSNSGDMNAAHIIRECLTDPDWGKGADESQIDDVAFMSAADQLYTEGMGLTLVWDTQSEIDAFIQVVLKHINAALYIDRSTGLWTLKLIRKDYNANTLITLNPSNIASISDYSRPAFGELINSVTVTYTDGLTRQDATITVQDIALSAMQGVTISASVDYKGFYNANIASKVAQRDLQTLSTPLRKCTIVANLAASNLNQGSVFKLTWSDYGITDLVMRVTDIGFGDGRNNSIEILCVEDVFALPTTQFIQPDEPIWVNPTQPPTALTKRLVFEAPYLELVQILGQDVIDSKLSTSPEIGYIAAAAARPVSGNRAQLWDDLGSGYTQVGSLDFCPAATLNANISYMDITFAITNGSDLAQVNLGIWLQIDQEIMVVTALSDTSITVKRGCLDTIPTPHSTGATLFFWDNYASGDDTQLVIGNTPKVKLLTVNSGGVLDISSAPEDTTTIVGRAARPYNMANVRLNGLYYPTAGISSNLGLTWSNRNRISQTGGTIYGFTDANIAPESGLTYTITVLNSDLSAGYTATGLTGTTATITSTTLSSMTANCILQIAAYRSGLQSYQNYQIPFINLNSNDRVTEDVNSRTTESGTLRGIE
jgi:hypothetical protein